MIKFLTLNIFKGCFLDEVIRYMRQEEFDIIQLQEVAGGILSCNKGTDCFQLLKESLQMEGHLLSFSEELGDKSSYFGNATFFKPHIQYRRKTEIRFLPYIEVDHNKLPVRNHPKCALSMEFTICGKPLTCINTHQAWGPTPEDEPHKLEQARKLQAFLKGLKTPFVLSGDFNVVPNTEVIALFNTLGQNLTSKHGVTNTLDARVHRAKHLFPPGLAVDYIFLSPTLGYQNFEVLSQHKLSDHFGLRAEILL